MAGLAPIDAGVLGKWGVAVIATAQRVRDREIHAEWRFALGSIFVSAIVTLFGGWALRNERREATAEAARAADERLQNADKLATMGALASGIAHEVATPLGVILGRAEQLAPRVASDEKAQRAVQAIKEQSERIDQVVRGFLRLARGDRPTLEREDPEALVRAAVDLARHRFTKAGVALDVAVSGALPKIACEARLFEQVLVNLLLNACDACVEAGSGAVTIGARAVDGKVIFEVDDDGSGIGEEAARRATEAFFTTKPSGRGTGLGLAIANEIVKHHRGTLGLAPRSPRGTRAVVEIPV
jgi:signal transduction histidine kinase